MPPSSLPALSAIPTITPGSEAHAALIERAQRAYEAEHHAERARMLLHLLQNTIRCHCDPHKGEQMAELGRMIDGIQAARFPTFSEFSKLALGPFVKRHKPTPPERKPMSRDEFALRRQLEEEARVAHIKQLAGARRAVRFDADHAIN